MTDEVIVPTSRLHSRQEVELAENGSQTIEFVVPSLALGTRHAEIAHRRPGRLDDRQRAFPIGHRAQPWLVLVVAPRDVNTSAFVEAIAPYRASAWRIALPTNAWSSRPRKSPITAWQISPPWCLLDPTPLPTTAWEQLGTYVRDGGQLALFLGHHAGDGSSFNTREAVAVAARQAGSPVPRLGPRRLSWHRTATIIPSCAASAPSPPSCLGISFPYSATGICSNLAAETQVILRLRQQSAGIAGTTGRTREPS